MDVLVTWRDGTKNVVSTNEIQILKKGEKFQIGVKIKMLYKRKWYYGTISALEDSSSDDEPLYKYIAFKNSEYNDNCEYKDCRNAVLTTCLQCCCFICAEHFETSEFCSNNHFAHNTETETIASNQCNIQDTLNFSEKDYCTPDELPFYLNQDNRQVRYCEFSVCTQEVFSSCHRCHCFLCWDHFENCDSSCENHFSSAENVKLSYDFPLLQTNKQTCQFIFCTNPILTTCFLCNCFLCDVHFEVTAEQSCLNHSKSEDPNQIQIQLERNNIEEPHTDCEEMEKDILNTSNETAVLLDDLDGSPSILRNSEFETAQSIYCDYPACINVITSNCSKCALLLCSEHLSVHIASCGQNVNLQVENLQPEDFVIDGAPRENTQVKPKRINKFKQAKRLRQHGKEYISIHTNVFKHISNQ